MVMFIILLFRFVTVNKKVWLTKNYWGEIFLKRGFKNFSNFHFFNFIFFQNKKIKLIFILFNPFYLK